MKITIKLTSDNNNYEYDYDDFQVSVCAMKKHKKKYVNESDSIEVEVFRRDTYDKFAEKAALAVGLQKSSMLDKVFLLKPKSGSRVINDNITMRDGLKEPWTIGAYLRRARKGAEKVHFGVAITTSETQPVSQHSDMPSGSGCSVSDHMADSGSSKQQISTISLATLFSMEELEDTTKSFSHILGEGAYGIVYLGKNIRNSATCVAVKVLNKAGEKGVRDKIEGCLLENEISALTKFRHPNLVALMGFHESSTMTALVYEHMAEGSLYTHLHDSSKDVLSWEIRLNILRDCCRALCYLHAGKPPLVHQDVKSQNILLDTTFKAKLGDFGFALDIPENHSGRTLVSAPLIARTEGYFAPELIGGKISSKSDVYSFGVVILETFSGQKAYDRTREDPELALLFEDNLRFDDKKLFTAFVDDRLSGSPDMIMLTLLFTCAKKAVVKHSIRATSAELMELFEEYDD